LRRHFYEHLTTPPATSVPVLLSPFDQSLRRTTISVADNLLVVGSVSAAISAAISPTSATLPRQLIKAYTSRRRCCQRLTSNFDLDCANPSSAKSANASHPLHPLIADTHLDWGRTALSHDRFNVRTCALTAAKIHTYNTCIIFSPLRSPRPYRSLSFRQVVPASSPVPFGSPLPSPSPSVYCQLDSHTLSGSTVR